MANPEPNKSYRTKSQLRYMWLALCLAGAALTAASFAGGPHGAGGTTLLVGAILMAVWTHRASPVKLFDDHLEVRAAPLAATKRVLYRDIRKVERKSKSKALLTYDDGTKERSLKLPLFMLAPDDAESLLTFLEARVA